MDGIAPVLRHKLERFHFLLSLALRKKKRVVIFGHPGCDIDLIATYRFLSALCWELGALDVELVHRVTPGEVEDPRLSELGVVPLENRHFADDQNVVRILADCSDLARVFGLKDGAPRIDFIVDHHIPAPELAVPRAEYLICPEFGCAALMTYLLLQMQYSVLSTTEGQNLALSAFATDNDLYGNDLWNSSLEVPEVHPSIMEFCSKLYRTLLGRGELKIFYQLVEEPWQNPNFALMLRHALDHCLEVSAPEAVAVQLGTHQRPPRKCLLRLVELPEVPTPHWIAKLAGMLLRAVPLRPEATLVRAPVGNVMVTSVRTRGELDASKLIRRFEGDGGGRTTLAGFTRPRTAPSRFIFPQSVSTETRIGSLAGQIIEFLRKED